MSITGRATAPVKAPRWLTALMTVLVAGISLLAFGLSFEVLSDLAIRAGLPAGMAWAWPVIVDGSIVTAMLVIFAWRGRPRRATVWPWVTLLFFAAVSVVGNGVHTAVVYNATQGITMWFAIFVGAVPPVGLLLSSEMLVRLLTPADRVAAAPAATVAAPVAAAVVTVAAPSHEPVAEVTKLAAPAAISDERPSENTEFKGIAASFSTAAPLSPERVTPVGTLSHEPDTEATEAVAKPEEILGGDSDMTVTPVPVTAAVTPVATATHLHAVEVIPDDPAGQVDWIVARAHAGHDMTRETLLRVFKEAGQLVSDRTLQRRLAIARDQAPELLQANA